MADCDAGLRADEREVIDFLVLAQCRSFVGFGMSTFSLFLFQSKAAGGRPALLVRGVHPSIEEFYKFNVLDDLEPEPAAQVEPERCQAVYDSEQGAGGRNSSAAERPYPGADDSVAICLVVKDQVDDILEVR